MEFTTLIDNISFTLNNKFISEDRIYVQLTSNQQTESTKKDVKFVVYKSNSQGMWRYFTCGRRDCPFKWEDYTTTTMIDFRLQYFINKNLDIIPINNDIVKARDYATLIESVSEDYIKDFMKMRNVFIPEFDVIWRCTKNTSGNIIQFAEFSTIGNMKEYTDEQMKEYKKAHQKFINLFENPKIIYTIHELLKYIGLYLNSCFTPLMEKQMYTFDKSIFNFENATLQDNPIQKDDDYYKVTCNIIPSIKKSSTRIESKKTLLYPFSKNIEICQMIIQYKPTGKRFTLYYMQYKITNDNTDYYMPLLITPENTRISIYGMPEKYVRTGIFCNKPWDYQKYAFFNPGDNHVKQICRATDNYIFMGKSYKDIWPFNTLNQNPIKDKIKFLVY